MHETSELEASLHSDVFKFVASASTEATLSLDQKVQFCFVMLCNLSFIVFSPSLNVIVSHCVSNRVFALGQMDQLDDTTFKHMFRVG